MVHAQIQIFFLLQRARLLRERGDQAIGACLSFQTLCFCFFFFLVTSYFFFCFVLLPFLLNAYFWTMVFPRNSYYYDFSNPPFQCTARGPLYRTCRDWYLLFQPLTAFVWCGCPCRPLTSRQLFNYHHLLVLAVLPPFARQRRLFCLFACRGFSTHYSVCAFSLYPSWHAPSGSNSSLLLLGGMSSQQDISPKRT